MAKAFSVASWNVEHFKGDPSRTNRVIGFIKQQNPDVIGMYEVEGAAVFTEVTAQFPGCTFQITEGPQTQEILVGFRNYIYFVTTQKLEFRSGTTHMRPGLLATITLDGARYSLLFLHLASSNEPRGFGLRDEMTIRAIKFRKTLNKATEGNANYIFLGDLQFTRPSDGTKADVEVRGWVDKVSTVDKYNWIRDFSDHSLLYFEVQKV